MFVVRAVSVCFFFFTTTAPPDLYTLSLHDALPISFLITGVMSTAPGSVSMCHHTSSGPRGASARDSMTSSSASARAQPGRSEEHTSELQSQSNLVCRLLLEKKKKKQHKKRHRDEPA